MWCIAVPAGEIICPTCTLDLRLYMVNCIFLCFAGVLLEPQASAIGCSRYANWVSRLVLFSLNIKERICCPLTETVLWILLAGHGDDILLAMVQMLLIMDWPHSTSTLLVMHSLRGWITMMKDCAKRNCRFSRQFYHELLFLTDLLPRQVKCFTCLCFYVKVSLIHNESRGVL